MGNRFIQNFEIPEAALPYLDLFFSGQEQWFGEVLDKAQFTAEDAAGLLASEEAGERAAVTDGWITDAAEFLGAAYRDGFVSFVDKEAGIYRLNNFYGKLDLFSVTEKERYDTLSNEAKHALDDWYFDEYYDSLDTSGEVLPTGDRMYLLEEMLAYIDSQDRQVYLNHCDCRSLTGECGLPTRTCLTYNDGPNTFADRGHLKKITKEEAKQVILDADKAGLMHTANAGGICNCCGDCCYLFRTQVRMGTPRGFWPPADHIVSLNEDRCIACGRCTRRCHFEVFEVAKDAAGKRYLKSDTDRCAGCGICTTTCPTQALTMVLRNAQTV